MTILVDGAKYARIATVACPAVLLCLAACKADGSGARRTDAATEFCLRAPDPRVSTYYAWFVFAETRPVGQTAYLLVQDSQTRKPRLSEVTEDDRFPTLEDLAVAIGRLDYTAFVWAPGCDSLKIDVRGAKVRQLTEDEVETLYGVLDRILAPET